MAAKLDPSLGSEVSLWFDFAASDVSIGVKILPGRSGVHPRSARAAAGGSPMLQSVINMISGGLGLPFDNFGV